MARWQRLSEAQITELFDPPVQQRELIRHFTLTATDLAAILRCRGDSNRLGYGLMLCYLNYPGRALRAGERPPAALIGNAAISASAGPMGGCRFNAPAPPCREYRTAADLCSTWLPSRCR